MKYIILLAGTLLFTSSVAQTVHKCPGPDGKMIYKQTECGGGVTGDLKIDTGNPSQRRRATDEEIAQCLKLIKAGHNFKDPDSLKVEGGAFANEYPSGRKEILFELNGKNSYGAYAGAKPAYCKYKANGDLDDVKAF